MLYNHDPAVLRKIAAVREQTRLVALLPSANAWLAVVRSLYSARFWDALADRWQYNVTFCRA